jgi:hypothetical protein
MKRPLLAVAVLATLACSDTPGPVAPAVTRIDATASLTSAVTFYGPERFTRATGAPQTATRTISTQGYVAPFTLHVTNGGATSGSVTFDGRSLLGPSDFKKSGGSFAFAVTPGATGTLTVELAGKPGSYVDVWLEGTPAATLFCPAGGPGAYTSLQDAVNNTDPDGTILVCDGAWDVDSVSINRPLTIRSQHPHAALLGDSDPAPVPQNGRPALAVDGVASGLVRIVDLNFAARGRAIALVGTYDQVAIDSCSFEGRDANTAFLVNVRASTVPGARVEITNSEFADMGIGIFNISSVETNVRHNTFTRFVSGSVTYSGNTADFSTHGVIEDNTISHCGAGGCLRTFMSRGAIRNNVIDASGTATKLGGIVTLRSAVFASDLEPLVIENNVINGGGQLGGPSPAVSSNWAAQAGLFIQEAGPGLIIRRNTVTNASAFAQVAIVSGATVITMTDNTQVGGYQAFRRTTLNGTLNVNRNDFTSVIANTFFVQTAATPAAGSYTCNWWGSPAGPATPQVSPGIPLPTALYLPAASAPVANQPGVTCP